MELNEIKVTLEENFNKELLNGRKRNIVFWYDDNGEFEQDIDELGISNAKVLKLNKNNSFYIKYLIEKEDKDTNYLIYAPFSKPNSRENWLLDILKYSFEFSTDKVEVIMRDFNVKDDSLKNVFRKYLKFFNNKERYKACKALNIEIFSEETVDLGVLSVLCKLPYVDLEAVIRILIMEDSKESNKYYEAIEKFGDVNSFWRVVQKYYGYELQEKSLENLIIMLMITNLSDSIGEKIPNVWWNYVSQKKANCIVFLSNFMNHAGDSTVYDELANKVEEKIRLKEYVDKWDTDIYAKSDTFKYFDEAIINKLQDKLLQDIGEFDKYKELILNRRTKHWYNTFQNEYECIYWANELFNIWKNISLNLKQWNAYDFYDLYTKEYYAIDTAYRKFYYSFDKLNNKEALIDLKEKVENTYVNGYLNTLSIKWSGSIEELNGNWNIPGQTMQQDFYTSYIKPHLDKNERVFVIISDGLRYEAAREFYEILNTDRKGSTDIYSMVGSIPSYTKLGMASLLPHKEVIITKGYEVFVDGFSTEGTDNRNKIINNYNKNSLAVQFSDIVEMKRDDLRKILGGKELIYIYHNCIDARGDHAPTEREVFSAVDETFEELKNLINSLVNNVTATYIYIVADHGFVYKRGNLTESEKLGKETLNNSIENRRFILTNKDEKLEGTLTFNMNYILNDVLKLNYITPRGINRFKIQGAGANYVHGGTSLQEIVIPVIRFKNDRSKMSKNDIKKVDVKLTSISRKITNTITFLEFFQTEKVEEKRVPMRLKLYFIDEEGNRVSNENIIIADVNSSKSEDRMFREKFVLKNMQYDKSKKYYLIFEDEEEKIEKIYDKIPFIIDIAISNDDFGF